MATAIGKPSGARKQLINSMLMVIGKIRILANVTYFPVIQETPQSNSIALAKGIKYVEAIKPTWKALKSPVVTGSGTSFKKKLTEANRSKSPINTRITMVAIFINKSFEINDKPKLNKKIPSP